MSRILMVASEAFPYATTGGLSDVLGTLPGALKALGHQVVVLLPRYRQTKPSPLRRIWGNLPVELGNQFYQCSLFQAEHDESYLFLDYPAFYDRANLYGDEKGEFQDNAVRFGLLARAALEVIRHIFAADVVHCHDWQAGLIPFFLRQTRYDPTFLGIKTLFTVHNLGYQGQFPSNVLASLGVPISVFVPESMEFWGQLNFLKAGLVYSDGINTVSPQYAQEIQTPEYGFGLDGLLRSRNTVLSGILNGADYQHWNPATDTQIPARYSPADLAGKQVCKQILLQEFGLPAEAIHKPLLGVLSRFTDQKGFTLLADAAAELFRSHDVYLVALGDGDAESEALFRNLAVLHPDRVAVHIGYNRAAAHRVLAGSDIFLMPSRYEPCGLNQMYSLKYGTVPVVRATGGLADTVSSETGFCFGEYDSASLLKSLREALTAYQQKQHWTAFQKAGMAQDFSWDATAREYSQLYVSLLNPSAA